MAGGDQEWVRNSPELALLGSHPESWGQLWASQFRKDTEGLEHVSGREQS